MSRIARVFPRRTQATPTDALTFTDEPGLLPHRTGMLTLPPNSGSMRLV